MNTPVNPRLGTEYVAAMQDLRRSSATSCHTNRHAEAKKRGTQSGPPRGGRNGAKVALRKEYRR